MKYRYLLVVVVLSMCGVGSVAAQVVTPSADALQHLDGRVRAYMKHEHIPGALIAAVSKGKVLHLKTYGLANVELRVPVTDSTVFEIGSISKQFVAAVTMQLVEEQKIDLDDAIDKYIAGLPGEWLGVTIRHLLTHTSGIPDYEEIRSYDVYQHRLTLDDVIQFAHSRPMDFEPGAGWTYSNTGYYLLSFLIERVEGLSLGRILENRIFKPLNMQQTRMTTPEDVIPHRASGYWIKKTGQLINRRPTEVSATLGAGGLLTSVHDMIAWDLALYGDDLLKNDSKSTMWSPTHYGSDKRANYGFGWEVYAYKGLQYQGHSGMVAGFVAEFARFPDQEISFIVFLNRYDVSSYALAEAMIETFMPDLE